MKAILITNVDIWARLRTFSAFQKHGSMTAPVLSNDGKLIGFVTSSRETLNSVVALDTCFSVIGTASSKAEAVQLILKDSVANALDVTDFGRLPALSSGYVIGAAVEQCELATAFAPKLLVRKPV
ncbi:MAG: hypothetical protein JSS20_11475 [Proteobacteria bacterium]|nr:hypothetical protein [Pseudomonadota bacterium]